ncbi:MAG: hypothetical protein ACTSX4_01140 [Candidatus Helarchaeota archaeon]
MLDACKRGVDFQKPFNSEKIKKLIKQEREARKRKKLLKIKNDEKLEETKEDYDKKLQELT